MINVTLDNNLLIDLEQQRPFWQLVDRIRKLGEEGKIIVSIPSILASENPKPGVEKISNFSKFKDWINSLGFTKATFLPPIGYFDVTFFDNCLCSGPDLQKLELAIHTILVPTSIPMSAPSSEIRGKWLNWKCDVLTIWSHVWHKTDFLVTRDQHLVDKAQELGALGAKIIHLNSPDLERVLQNYIT